MKNEAAMKPFPDNLFADLGMEAPEETPEDFYGTLMYVLYTVASPRDVKVILMRYKQGKPFESIADALGISKQRASAVVQDVFGKITGNHMDMLTYGMKRYEEGLLADRMNSLAESIDSAEREAIRAEAYAKGLHDGKKLLMPEIADSYHDVIIETLGVSNRTYNACDKNNLRNLADLLEVGDGILDCRSFGVKCFHELCSILQGMNINPMVYYPRTIEKIGMVAHE